jgi:hypothetical protein
MKPSIACTLILFAVSTWGLLQLAFRSQDPEPPSKHESGPATGEMALQQDMDAELTFNPPREPVVESRSALTAEEFVDRLPSLLTISDYMTRSAAAAELVANLDATKIQQVLQSLGPEDLESETAQLLVTRWIGTDPSGAAEWTLTLGQTPLRRLLISQLGAIWANDDLSSAISWTREKLSGEEKEILLRAIGNEAARFSPLEALHLMKEMQPGEERDRLLTHAASQWAVNDAGQLMSWVNQFQAGPEKDRLVAGIIPALADSNPRMAADLAVQQLPRGRIQNDAVVSIVQRWAQQEPENASAWVERFPQGVLQTDAAISLIQQWNQTDAAGAERWVEGLAAGGLRDAVTQEHARLRAITSL